MLYKQRKKYISKKYNFRITDESLDESRFHYYMKMIYFHYPETPEDELYFLKRFYKYGYNNFILTYISASDMVVHTDVIYTLESIGDMERWFYCLSGKGRRKLHHFVNKWCESKFKCLDALEELVSHPRYTGFNIISKKFYDPFENFVDIMEYAYSKPQLSFYKTGFRIDDVEIIKKSGIDVFNKII